jgi:mono/diheme cytochrome c family protein
LLGLVLAAGAFAYAWQPELAPVEPPAADTFDPALVRRGATLALIGDCRTCHTAPGGRTFAGGLPLPTPFGTLYSTNITPDPDTGIGRWSEAAFARALREGVDREGRHLYPAFPYDHYTLTSDADVEALYAFFLSREPVVATAPPNGLPFPLNIRLVLAGWKLLFFRADRLAPDPARDEVWNRGRYLVEGLGHCGACHSPRNLAGAEQRSQAYKGGEAEGWHAYALGRASQAPVPWTEAALTQYLADGFHPQHGVARGPMAPVVENLAAVPREDVAAMARYLASLGAGAGSTTTLPYPAGPGLQPQVAGAQAATPPMPGEAGAQIYATACASCHEGGRPTPLGGLPLALSTGVAGESPENLVNIILQGLPAAGGVARPIMPGFGGVLNDRQLADLVAYLRRHVGGKPAWTGVEGAIRNARTARQVAMRPAPPTQP